MKHFTGPRTKFLKKKTILHINHFIIENRRKNQLARSLVLKNAINNLTAALKK